MLILLQQGCLPDDVHSDFPRDLPSGNKFVNLLGGISSGFLDSRITRRIEALEAFLPDRIFQLSNVLTDILRIDQRCRLAEAELALMFLQRPITLLIALLILEWNAGGWLLMCCCVYGRVGRGATGFS